MAQDAELKLKVSLDLAFFRQQLSTIGTQLGGQSIQLNVQFDRQAIANQYRLLDNALSRRVFKVKIESPTLDKLAEKVSTFKKNLAALGDEKIDLAVSVVSNIDEIRKSIKSKLPSVQIQTELAEPTNVDDFIREVGKKVKGQVEKSYTSGGVPIATKLETPGTTNLIKALQKNFNNQDPLRAKVSTTPSIVGEDVKAFRNAVKEKFSGIVVKIKAELEGAGQGASGQETRNFSQAALRKLGQDIKPLYRAAADAGLVEFNESIANNIQSIARELSSISGDLIEGLLNGLKSKDPQVKAAAKSLGQALISSIKGILGIASPSKVFKAIGDDVGKGFELGAVASMDKAFDALEQKLQERLRKLQSMLSLAPSRRSAFPFVAMGGAPESGPIAREIDQAYAQIAQIQQRRQERLAVQRGGLAQIAGRLLPPARDRSLPAARETIIPGGGALDQVTKGFVQSLRNTRDTLARNFSANTYLPKATRALATSMNVATKQLSGTKIAGLLPSKEMMESLRFQRAQQRAAQIDAENIARQQAQKALDQANLRAMFQGTPRINAPRVGQEETAIGRHIQNKIEQAIRNARQTLGLPLGPSSPYVANPFAGAATVPPRQYFQAGGQAALPPAGGTEPWAELQRGTEEMLRRNERMIASADRAMAALDRMIAARSGGGALPPGGPPKLPPGGPPNQPPGGPPNQPPGDGQRGGALGFRQTVLTPEYFENAKKYSAALEIARATSVKFTASQLPLIGGLKEVAGEFGFAIKQVLLFGTAYKGLAFVQSLPGQILNAAKSQQQYNNALQTATQDTGTFAKELLYVDNVQRAFGLNLQTTRDGFTKLYASMAPADFDSGSIEKLFTGISAATAALQLTPDKAERVIYAFGQMASKGQIMSEELKGQLGDVLPGALAIFAKAAGMSVKEFSEAMEDGEFVGSKFRDTFAKVADELMRRFGTGAQAAGKSLQGLLNTVQGDFQRTLESFAPLADAAAQAILGPIGGSLKQLSMSAQIATGEFERTVGQMRQAQRDLVDLKVGGADASEIKAAEKNLAALVARYKVLRDAAKDPAIAKQAQDIQLFTQELAKAGTFVMNMAKAIGSALSPILNILGTNLTTVISLITSFYIGFQAARLAAMALMGVLLLYRGLSALLGFGAAAQQATALAGAFNLLGVSASRAQIQVVGLRLALTALVATTVVGLVVAGIVAIAGAFATMSDRAKEAAQSSRDAAKSAIDAARSGNVAAAGMAVQNILTESRKAKAARETIEAIYARATPAQRKGAVPVSLTSSESVALQGSALTASIVNTGIMRGGRREIRVPSANEMQNIRRQFGSLAGTQAVNLKEAKEALDQAERTAEAIGLNMPNPSVTTETETPDKSAGRTKLQDFQSDLAANLKMRLETEKLAIQNRIDLANRTKEVMIADKEYAYGLKIIDAQLAAAKKEADKYKESQRGIAMAEAEVMAGQERLKVQRQFEQAVVGGLISKSEEYKDALIDLEYGTEDLTERQKAEILIRKELRGLNSDQIKTIEPLLAQIRAEAVAIDERTEALKRESEARKNRKQIVEDQVRLETEIGVVGKGLGSGYIGEARRAFEQTLSMPGATREDAQRMADLTQQLSLLKMQSDLAEQSIQNIGSAFGDAMTKGVSSLVEGTATAQEVFAGFLKQIAETLMNAAAQMIATYTAIGIARMFAGMNGGSFAGGAKIGQTVNMPAGVGIGAGGGILQNAGAQGFGTFGPNFGIRQFANGGIVTGPTMGLIGEGRYNEAVVPLPDGKSIPVDLGGSMGDSGVNIVVNVDAKGTNVQGDNQMGKQLGGAISAAVQAELIKQKRPGGLLAR